MVGDLAALVTILDEFAVLEAEELLWNTAAWVTADLVAIAFVSKSSIESHYKRCMSCYNVCQKKIQRT